MFRDDYRFGFNGMEMDNEIKGVGNSINYKYRMHDPRIGRFFAVDPLTQKFPWNSPYAFCENSTISYVELEGLERVVADYMNRSEKPTLVHSWESLYPGEKNGPQGTGTLHQVLAETYVETEDGKLRKGSVVLLREYYTPFLDDIKNKFTELMKNDVYKQVEGVVKSDILGLGMKKTLNISSRFASISANVWLNTFEAKGPAPIDFIGMLPKQYYVVAGSFKNEENANKQAAEVGGFVMPITEEGFYRVAALVPDDYNEASKKRDELDKEGIASWTFVFVFSSKNKEDEK